MSHYEFEEAQTAKNTKVAQEISSGGGIQECRLLIPMRMS